MPTTSGPVSGAGNAPANPAPNNPTSGSAPAQQPPAPNQGAQNTTQATSAQQPPAPANTQRRQQNPPAPATQNSGGTTKRWLSGTAIVAGLLAILIIVGIVGFLTGYIDFSSKSHEPDKTEATVAKLEDRIAELQREALRDKLPKQSTMIEETQKPQGKQRFIVDNRKQRPILDENVIIEPGEEIHLLLDDYRTFIVGVRSGGGDSSIEILDYNGDPFKAGVMPENINPEIIIRGKNPTEKVVIFIHVQDKVQRLVNN